MRRGVLFALACAAMLGSAMIFHSGSANGGGQPSSSFPTPLPSEAYDPYPPGILPSNLDSEIARVQKEIQGIENEAIAEWQALPAPDLTGNPPILEGSGYQAVEVLGKLLNFDSNMSPFKDEACAFCHMPYAGFSGPIPSVNLTMVAYPGSAHYRAAKRTAQRYTYSPDFPVLEYNTTQGAFFGGNFWDARSTGYLLQSPDAEQAQHPPVDPDEMGLPDTACIAYRLESAVYKSLFEEVRGDSLDIRFPQDTEEICDTPNGAEVFGSNTTPIDLSPSDRAKANAVYNHWGQSISKYERSLRMSAFSSKFDAFLANKYTMTADEMAGYNLFRGKANCNSCHLDGRSTAPTPPPPEGTAPNSTDTGAAANTRPLFTCWGYANLGLPLNPRIALFYETTPDSFGYTPNPYGFGYRDLGVGTFLRSGFGSGPNPNSNWIQYAPTSDGQMQTSTARDVAMTPPQCPTTEAGQTDQNGNPIPYFQKEFFHNGYIKSLKQLVHFYNTRDVYMYPVTARRERRKGWTAGRCPRSRTTSIRQWACSA